jgi:hypothetical protein
MKKWYKKTKKENNSRIGIAATRRVLRGVVSILGAGSAIGLEEV